MHNRTEDKLLNEDLHENGFFLAINIAKIFGNDNYGATNTRNQCEQCPKSRTLKKIKTTLHSYITVMSKIEHTGFLLC